jgi:hypothetical protein
VSYSNSLTSNMKVSVVDLKTFKIWDGVLWFWKATSQRQHGMLLVGVGSGRGMLMDMCRYQKGFEKHRVVVVGFWTATSVVVIRVSGPRTLASCSLYLDRYAEI